MFRFHSSPVQITNNGTEGSRFPLLLHFELLNERIEMRRHWKREGFVVVLQRLPDCKETNHSVASGIEHALVLSGMGSGTDLYRVSTYPVVHLVRYSSGIGHGSFPTPPPSFRAKK